MVTTRKKGIFGFGSDTRRDEPIATRKQRGKAVTVGQRGKLSPEVYARASEQIHQEALKATIARLPAHVRTQWPHGNADHAVLDDGDMYFTVTLRHKTRMMAVSRTALVTKQDIQLADSAALTRVAKGIASYLTAEVRVMTEKYETEKTKEQLQTELGKYGQHKHPVTPDKVVEDYGYYKKQTDKNKKVGKAGVFCMLCGAEDRDAYPDWGGCPHVEEEDD